MRQSTKFYAVLLCAALGFSTAIQSCKDYDDDIDGLQEQIDAVNKSIESLKKDFGALAYVKDVKWDESTRTLTITPATGNPVTYKIADADTDTQDGNTKYTLTSSKDGNKITITLKGDDSSEQKVEFELPSADSITKDDITLNEQGFICVKGEPTSVQMPQGFDFAKMEVVKENGKLYLKYGDTKKELTAISQFDPAALTFESDDKGNIVVKYLGEPTGQTIKLPETAIVEKEDGSGFIIKVGDKQVEIVNLNILKAELKSLVFIPELYYQGIEAMAANTFFYNPLTLKAVTADGDHNNDAPIKSDKELSVTPTLKAQYHLNPSNAAVSKENLSFIFDNKPYTKAGEMEVIIKDANVENGVLTVFAGLANGTIKDIANDEEVSTLALQAVTASGEKGDTTITSDYAAIKAIALRNFALAEPSIELELSDWHHFKTAEVAIENTDEKHIYPLLWNDKDGIDVAELVQTHIGVDLAMHSALDKDATTDEIKAYGFKYNYELVGYHAGNNKTSQSAHAAMKGSRLRAQATVNGKQQTWDEGEQNRSTIGRMPLVRVSLVDTTAKQVVAVAYLKFKITDKETEAPVDEVKHVANFTRPDNYTVGCTPESYSFSLNWANIEEGIYSALNLSKEEFEAQYKLDGDLTNLKQFNNTTIQAKEVDKALGVVSRKQEQTGSEMTEVLSWTLTQNEAYNVFSANKKEATVIVRFVKENGNATKHYVYVTWTWKPEVLNANPEGEILDDNNTKFKSAWFVENTGVSGFDEVHFNVEVPETGATCKFEKDILDVFVGKKVTISNVADIYESFTADKLVKEFVFVTPDETKVKGADGNSYKLSVADEGLTLMATLLDDKGNETTTSDKVAVLSTVESNDAQNNYVTYQDNDIAKAVLNYAGHKELEDYQTLTAKVQVNVTNGCDQKLNVKNNTFDVKFLRPISINKVNNGSLVDATDNGSELNLNKVMEFVDWRTFKFVPDNMNYFEYYGVKSIKISVDDIMLGDKKLKDVYSADIRFTEATEAEIQKGEFGILYWHNSGNTLSEDITIDVPVKVTYKWGNFKVMVPVVVKKTIGQ